MKKSEQHQIDLLVATNPRPDPFVSLAMRLPSALWRLDGEVDLIVGICGMPFETNRNIIREKLADTLDAAWMLVRDVAIGASVDDHATRMKQYLAAIEQEKNGPEKVKVKR